MIKGKIVITKWKIKPKSVARGLAAQPGIHSALLGLAEEVAEGTRKRFQSASKPPKVDYHKYRGRYWSADPSAVGAQYSSSGKLVVGVKDIRDLTTAKGRIMPVALVVANHPYSRTYEKGLDEFPQTNAMAGALQASANRRPRRLSRRPAAP